MANKIQIRRGLKANLPILSVGELGFATDAKELFIGSVDGNQAVVMDGELTQYKESILAQQETKVSGKWSYFTRDDCPALGITDEDTIDSYLEKLPNKSTMVHITAGTWLKLCPPGQTSGVLIVTKVGATRIDLQFTSVYNAKFFGTVEANTAPPKFLGWTRQAIAEPPMKCNVPLATGFSGSCNYLKTQENFVMVNFSITRTDGAAFSTGSITLPVYLPAGFRPASDDANGVFTGSGRAQGSSIDTPAVAGYIHSVDGGLRISVTASNIVNVVGCAFYYAP